MKSNLTPFSLVSLTKKKGIRAVGPIALNILHASSIFLTSIGLEMGYSAAQFLKNASMLASPETSHFSNLEFFF